MNINYLEIQGFKSFRKKQRFSFSKYSDGLYYVSGDNRIEPDLGSNGSGKSSFFSDALVWILTGKTSLNLKAGNVKSWDDKTRCVGSLGFSRSKLDYIVTRSWNPNRLELTIGNEKPKPISQEELEDLTCFNFSSILHSVVLSQFSSKFLDFRPEEKLRIFSDIIGNMDKWLEFSDKASLKVKDIDVNIDRLEKSMENLDGQIQSLEELDYEQQIEEWKEEHKNSIKSIKTCISEIEDDIDRCENKIDEISKKIGNLADTLPKFTFSILELDKKIDNIDVDLDCLRLETAEFKAEIKYLENQIDELKKLKKNCPTCRQKISKEVINSIINDLENDLEKVDEEHKLSLDKLFKVKEKRGKLTDKLKTEEKNKEKLIKTVSDLEYEKKGLNSNLKSLNNELKSTKEDLEDKKNEKNPYLKLIEENKEKIGDLKDEITDTEKKVLLLQKERNINHYWVDGFKKIRLLIIKEALTEFEICINNNLQELGLHDWKIRLDVDRETKSKTIQKGFHVFIESPTKKEYVPFECYCGGERGRLKLAGVLGLIDFINNRKGSGCDIEIFDEPTTHLSVEGESDLIDILARRSREYGKKIFFIDHKDLGSCGEFDGIIEVMKDKNGSYIK